MPKADELLGNPAYSIWVNGPAGSGKTRLAMGFPKVFAVTCDPTGLDMLHEPENQALRENLIHYVPLNGLPLGQLFAFSETPGETGIYPAIALAKELAQKGEIKTFLLDGFTYLAQLKWTAILEAEGIDPNEKEKLNKKNFDSRKAYDALASYLDHLVLQNILPLTTRHKLNVVVTCHVQRESQNTIEGIEGGGELARQSKRSVKLDSDLAPQVLGGFRQRIDGLPSAMIYLDNILQNTEKDGKFVEEIKYIAYCKLTKSASFDTVIRAKNRYGLGTLNLTGASFYKTLVRKIEEQAKEKGSGAKVSEKASQERD